MVLSTLKYLPKNKVEKAKFITKNKIVLSFKNILKKKINLKKISENNYSIFFSRYIIPYFFHNIYYGLIKTNIVKFVIIIFLAEIPMTYALNLLGSSLKNFQLNYSLSNYSIFDDTNFYVSFIVIFVIFVLSNFFLKNK